MRHAGVSEPQRSTGERATGERATGERATGERSPATRRPGQLRVDDPSVPAAVPRQASDPCGDKSVEQVARCVRQVDPGDAEHGDAMRLESFTSYVVAGLATQRAVVGPVVLHGQGGFLVEQVWGAEVAPVRIEDGDVDVRERQPAQHPDQAQPGFLWALGAVVGESQGLPSRTRPWPRERRDSSSASCPRVTSPAWRAKSSATTPASSLAPASGKAGVTVRARSKAVRKGEVTRSPCTETRSSVGTRPRTQPMPARGRGRRTAGTSSGTGDAVLPSVARPSWNGTPSRWAAAQPPTAPSSGSRAAASRMRSSGSDGPAAPMTSSAAGPKTWTPRCGECHSALRSSPRDTPRRAASATRSRVRAASSGRGRKAVTGTG